MSFMSDDKFCFKLFPFLLLNPFVMIFSAPKNGCFAFGTINKIFGFGFDDGEVHNILRLFYELFDYPVETVMISNLARHFYLQIFRNIGLE